MYSAKFMHCILQTRSLRVTKSNIERIYQYISRVIKKLNSRSASQEIPAFCGKKCSLPCSQKPPSTVSSQINAGRILTTYFHVPHSGIQTEIMEACLSQACYMPRQSHSREHRRQSCSLRTSTSNLLLPVSRPALRPPRQLKAYNNPRGILNRG